MEDFLEDDLFLLYTLYGKRGKMPVKDERGDLDVSKVVKPVQATLSSLKMLDVGKWPIFSLCSEEELQLVRQACVFGSASNELLYTTVNDEIFVLGTNCYGCLGLGDVQSTIEPRRLDSLSGKKIACLSYGSGPHIVLATTGNLGTQGGILAIASFVEEQDWARPFH